MKESYDNGLKLFLDKDDLERLYDFEEESMEGLVREREAKQHQSTDERVRLIGERLDALGSKIEDAYQKSAHQNDGLQSLDFRLIQLEEVAEQTNASLAVIHRFMAFQRGNRMDDQFRQNKHRRSSKSSPNVAFQAPTLTVEDFCRHLVADPTLERNRGRRSSCAAFDPEDYDESDSVGSKPTSQKVQTVEPQDLVRLRSLGTSGSRQRTVSETSRDGANIMQSMEGQPIFDLSPSRHQVLGRTPSSERRETSPTKVK